MTAREWLLADSPGSRLQAGLGRAYAMAGLLLSSPLAVVGGLIVLLLVLTAAFAPLLAPESPLGQNLGSRLLPNRLWYRHRNRVVDRVFATVERFFRLDDGSTGASA